MLRRLRLFCGLLFLFSLLAACNPESMYFLTIQNNSSETFYFIFSDSSEYRFGFARDVEEYDTVNIQELMDLGQAKTFDCDPVIPDSTYTFTTKNGGHFSKKLSDPNNWICETDKKNTFWRLTFVINQSDLIYYKDPHDQSDPDPPGTD